MDILVNKIMEMLDRVEPLLLIIVPTVVAMWAKVKAKVASENQEIKKKQEQKNRQSYTEWIHQASINIVNRLQDVCNYHCDLTHVHTSFMMFENGTITTANVCNMYITCTAEDSRYSDIPKLQDHIQRIPFIRLSKWYNKVSQIAEHPITIINNKEDIDDILYNLGVRSMVSAIVKNPKGLPVGICNFIFGQEKSEEELKNYLEPMMKFISSVETVLFDYVLDLDTKKKELGIEESFDFYIELEKRRLDREKEEKQHPKKKYEYYPDGYDESNDENTKNKKKLLGKKEDND